MEVGTYEAKTQLPRLLERVRKGERITITRHGKPIAELCPVAGAGRGTLKDALAKVDAERARARERGANVAIADVVSAIREGRR